MNVRGPSRSGRRMTSISDSLGGASAPPSAFGVRDCAAPGGCCSGWGLRSGHVRGLVRASASANPVGAGRVRGFTSSASML